MCNSTARGLEPVVADSETDGLSIPDACAGIDCPYSEVVRYTRQIATTGAGDAWLTVSDTSMFRLLGE